METNIDPAADVIVKSDQTGRTRYPTQYKLEVLAAFRSSSLSAPVFARQCEIKFPTLAAWLRRGNVVTKTHHVGTLRPSSLLRLPLPPNNRRLNSNYSAGPLSAHRMRSRSVCSPPRLKLTAMLTFYGNLKVYVALARNHLGLDPLSGAAFLFNNKSRRLIKILYFDGTGYWLVAKRLKKGTFSWPQDIDGDRRKLMLKPTALAMLTDSIDLRDGLLRP